MIGWQCPSSSEDIRVARNTAERSPGLTIAIPTYCREQVLLETIHHLLSLQSPNTEILVLEGHRAMVANRFPGNEVYSPKARYCRKLKMHDLPANISRNTKGPRSLRLARSAIIAFVRFFTIRRAGWASRERCSSSSRSVRDGFRHRA
jgi:hypothetical protein